VLLLAPNVSSHSSEAAKEEFNHLRDAVDSEWSIYRIANSVRNAAVM
jgi:hypothetical protein